MGVRSRSRLGRPLLIASSAGESIQEEDDDGIHIVLGHVVEHPPVLWAVILAAAGYVGKNGKRGSTVPLP